MSISYAWQGTQKNLAGFCAIIALAALSVGAFALFAPIASAHEDEHSSPATVIVTKIVCATESDLPNYGADGPDITATTATAYVAAHPGCHLQSGWTFQYATASTLNPGDNGSTPAGSPWISFGLTNASGVTSATVSPGSYWIREVVQSGYIPFSGWLSTGHNTPSTSDKFSAEIYCDKDVLNYDNFDKVSPASGKTYYCVAWNASKTGTLTIVKNTVGENGTFDFSVSATDESTSTSATIATSDNTGSSVVTLPVGSYTVSEGAQAGWGQTSATCDGEQVPSNVAVVYGQNVTCTFTNALDHGTLTIIKQVSGGTKVASDFTFSIPGADPASVIGSETGTETSVPNGAYAVTEDQANQDNYTTAYGADCTGTMTPGAEKVCTVENTVTPPQEPQCVTPNSDTTMPFVFGVSNPPEETLQEMLTDGFYSLVATADNTNTTSWTGNGTDTANFTATFLDRVAGASSTFGYFANGDAFVPVFTEAPNAATPATVSFSVPALSTITFGISTTFGHTTNVFTTDPAANPDTADHAAVYHPSTNEYVMGFEDLAIPGADQDYNDMTVSVAVDSCTPPVPVPTTATISAEKIVCPTESELPNYGAGGPNITATTASDFRIAHPDCQLVPWTFEHAPDGTVNPGNGTGVAGGAWVPFTTGVGNIATAEIPAGALTWVREQFQSTYIPFSGVGGSNVSAELYCNTDVLNYDNYDWISSVAAGQTYYCVAWNVPTVVTPPQDPTCTTTQHLDNHVCVDNTTGGGDGGNTGDTGGSGPSGDTTVTDTGGSSGGGGPLILGQINGGSGQVLGASCGLYMNVFLKRGQSNDPDQVTKLQKFLVKHGFARFTPTGFFGSQTQAAVNAFQSKYFGEVLKPWGLAGSTGYVYKTTTRWINMIECPELTLPMPELN
jgi:hypothetical protein